MSLPKVAVIMATYEPSAAHLIGQLDSVQKQRNVEVDVYIGDDSKTSIVLEQIEGRYSNLIKSYESGPKSGRPVDNFWELWTGSQKTMNITLFAIKMIYGCHRNLMEQ